ncbi:MAG: DinB family protein [Anaerolineae bacterium]|nr:DinB family protein [Anaerolineae bacterium]
MNGIEVIREMFKRACGILDHVMKDVTQEMFDYVPPGQTNTIAWNYLHIFRVLDAGLLSRYRQDTPPIWDMGGWSEKIGIEWPENDPHEWAHALAAPLDTAREYAAAVAEAAEAYLGELCNDDLDRVIVTRADGTETALFDIIRILADYHIAVHTGEIAVLKGIQGKAGYGF